MDVIGGFIDLDRYQRGQGREETCTDNDFEQSTEISFNSGYPGGAETSTKNRNYIIMNMPGNINPTECLQKLLFKRYIKDNDDEYVITSIATMGTNIQLEKFNYDTSKKVNHLDKYQK